MQPYIRQLLLTCFITIFFAQNIHAKIWVNEVMSSNSVTIADEDGEFHDWIELYNSSDQDVDLEGMHLSDKADDILKWTFPSVILPSKSFLLVWASGKDKVGGQGELHANFKVSVSGEEVILSDPTGNVIDNVVVPQLESDISYARIPDGGEEWVVTTESTPHYPNSFEQLLSMPIFSKAGGFYNKSFDLEITTSDTGAIVLYTLDGSDPMIEDIGGREFRYRKGYKELPIYLIEKGFVKDSIITYKYSKAIQIRDRTGESLDGASVPVTYAYEPDYFPKPEDVFRGTVVKSRVYKEGIGYGPLVTHTYFVTPNGRAKYDLPVISVSLSKKLLFDYKEGIYLAGEDFDKWRAINFLTPASPDVDANYQRRGREWEYPGQFEFFDRGVDTATLNQLVGYRIHGGWSRANPQKSLRVYARSDYGDSKLRYPFFEKVEQETYKRLILRRLIDFSFGDGLFQEMVSHLSFGTQASQLSILFINGEYWGLIGNRERLGHHYVEEKYGVSRDSIDYLYAVDGVKEGSGDGYASLIDFVSENSLKDSTNYAFVSKQIDVENYIDYYVAEIYSANKDWPHNNINYWRLQTDDILENVPYGHDGKWRWLMLDMDIAFGRSEGGENYHHNTLEHASRKHFSTTLFRGVLENEIFSNQFINRFADLLNTTFTYERIHPIVVEHKNSAQPFVQELLNRWKGKESMNRFDKYFSRILMFVKNRPATLRSHIEGKFNLEGQVEIVLDKDIRESGNYIRINTIDIHGGTVGVSNQPYPWKGIYFKGVPVEVTAVAAPGYRFSHWEGMPEGTPARFVSTFDENIKIVAHFVATTEFHLKYTSSIGGFLEGDSLQLVNKNESGTPILAVPEQGYQFEKWSDGLTDNPRIDKNVLTDIEVTAIFSVATNLNEKESVVSKIYPNPVQNRLTIKLENIGVDLLDYSIQSIDGKQVQSGRLSKSSKQVIDVYDLPPSIYILMIRDQLGRTSVQKFIKQ